MINHRTPGHQNSVLARRSFHFCRDYFSDLYIAGMKPETADSRLQMQPCTPLSQRIPEAIPIMQMPVNMSVSKISTIR
jgi:hypothetical protein